MSGGCRKRFRTNAAPSAARKIRARGPRNSGACIGAHYARLLFSGSLPPLAMSSTSSAAALPGQKWFGHPRGLSTLFFTEMWERFSYYGMRALLILFVRLGRRTAASG